MINLFIFILKTSITLFCKLGEYAIYDGQSVCKYMWVLCFIHAFNDLANDDNSFCLKAYVYKGDSKKNMYLYLTYKLGLKLYSAFVFVIKLQKMPQLVHLL